MIDEIPKLLGKGFLIGYLIPSIIFVSFITYGAGIDFLRIGQFQDLDVEKIGQVILLVILIGFSLLFFNRAFVRLLEGYYKHNPLRMLRRYQISKFRQKIMPVIKEWERLESVWSKNEEPNPSADPALTENGKIAASLWPSREDLILPTKFGNAYRAYEDYPKVLYGMDAVVLWPRILAILPTEARDQIEYSRARLDCHVSLLILSIAAALITTINSSNWTEALWTLPALLSVFILWFTLADAARLWGVAFASIFDLYRRPLAESLGLDIPATMQEEREMWYDICRMILFRRAFYADALNLYRANRGASNCRDL